MATRISQRQKELLDREAGILTACRQMLLEEGYHSLTMERVAAGSQTPKGTLYQHFTSKEDMVLALSLQGLEGRLDMMRRGATYSGRTRERMVALGEGASLFMRSHPEDAEIMRMARGSMRERASAQRVRTATRIEHEMVQLVRDILEDAVAQGDLKLLPYVSVGQMTLALWALVEGGFTLVQEAVTRTVLEMDNPIHDLWVSYNVLADGYQWKPLFCEWDWEETLAEIRRRLFPEETQAVYGKDAWYGDAGTVHPRHTRFWPESAFQKESLVSCEAIKPTGERKEDES